MDTEELRRQVRALTDRAEITDLMDRYLRSLDEGAFDEEWARAFHTEDVTAEMPIGTVHGRPALLAHVRREWPCSTGPCIWAPTPSSRSTATGPPSAAPS